jgi:hypothetical protein
MTQYADRIAQPIFTRKGFGKGVLRKILPPVSMEVAISLVKMPKLRNTSAENFARRAHGLLC